jgi:predicted nucleotidyltransferase
MRFSCSPWTSPRSSSAPGAAPGLTQAELARRAGTSQSAIARYESGAASPSVRALERLLHCAGYRLSIVVEPSGARADLSGDRMRRLRSLRPAIEQAAKRAHARNVRVFGSVARGEDQPGSDIDILVDALVESEGILPLIRLQRELEELLGDRVDVSTPFLLKPAVAEHALAEAVPL